MDKKPEIDGAWLELDWNAVSEPESLEAIKAAKIVAVRMKNVRFEFSAEEKDRLASKLAALCADFSDELSALDKEQRAFLLWKMLLLS